MPTDHSKTYRSYSVKDLGHRLRARDIMRTIGRLAPARGGTYADIGCSNGYLTELIAERFNLAQPVGYDHGTEHFHVGYKAGRNVEFRSIDLNLRNAIQATYSFVTCFETLEHTGDLTTATENFLRAIQPGGKGLITVPIEIGHIGIFKFLIKTKVYGYSLRELPNQAGSWAEYFHALRDGRRISMFRDRRRGWGTHFGFDYRDLDDLLHANAVYFSAFNRAFTRFYLVWN